MRTTWGRFGLPAMLLCHLFRASFYALAVRPQSPQHLMPARPESPAISGSTHPKFPSKKSKLRFVVVAPVSVPKLGVGDVQCPAEIISGQPLHAARCRRQAFEPSPVLGSQQSFDFLEPGQIVEER